VYHEDRLTVIKPCMTVSGRVTGVRPEEDGDSHVYLTLDAPYSTSLNLSSLLLEIVPADKPGCTPGKPPRPPSGSYDYGICTGADEADPATGSHVTVTGPYVFDHNHGWNEIHPVWRISLTSAPAVGSTPGSTPTTNAVPSPISSTTAPARDAQKGVTIISVTPSVDAGAGASLVAQASPKASCDLGVTLPSGRHNTAQGLGPGTADAAGRVQWTWQTGNRTKSGTATATVTCGSASATTTFLFVR
jgi:hypothetical protein